MRALLILYKRHNREKTYYLSLSALLKDNDKQVLGAAHSTIRKHDFDTGSFKNEKIIISKDKAYSASDIS